MALEDPLAQLVEHMTFNHGAWGSNPQWITSRIKTSLATYSALRLCVSPLGEAFILCEVASQGLFRANKSARGGFLFSTRSRRKGFFVPRIETKTPGEILGSFAVRFVWLGWQDLNLRYGSQRPVPYPLATPQ